MSSHSQAEPTDNGVVDQPECTQAVLEADVVELAPGAELIPATSRTVIRPLDVDQVAQAMADHQRMLQALLERDDWQGPPNADGSFVKKSGWRKIARGYNLELTRLPEQCTEERNDSGDVIRATEAWRAVHVETGCAMDATGRCAITEPRFAKAAGRQKAENDVPCTAETRAKNRAISDLVGMGRVSAEEVDAGVGITSSELPFGPAIDDAERKRYTLALGTILPPADARAAWQGVTNRCGYMPQSVADLIFACAQSLSATEEATV